MNKSIKILDCTFRDGGYYNLFQLIQKKETIMLKEEDHA